MVLLPSTPASIPPQSAASGSTVFDLLSRLNPGASSSNQPPRPVDESNEKSPTPFSVASPGLDLRFMTVQQALPLIAKLTQRAEFRERLKSYKKHKTSLSRVCTQHNKM
ncbi:hypothetical protein RSOL_230170 [Rhizoctonia solani AG-3 Rhs1AP]|uniref:Uncharacterized protein n=1 Tax=Rhizoctonia solani AG-3 Rhs1AP TaxID=1086054 RepID=X8J6Z9_9AGAM|nr:hypothetical protein RSOL_230170 [Rhizoctonia solani AG-3 Rhs1AP]